MARIKRKNAQSMSEIIHETLRSMKVDYTMNNMLIFKAWDQASGAGDYTVRKFFRDGKLYITVSSSVIRSQLNLQKEAYLEKINKLISEDILFYPGENGCNYVKELIIK